MEIAEFIYNYTDLNLQENLLIEKIQIPFEENLDELINKLQNDLPSIIKYFDTDLKESITNFIKLKNQEYYDKNDDMVLQNVHNSQIDIDSLIKEKEKLYKDELLQFADKVGPTDEEIFAQSFHRLVHSSPSLPDILEKEKGYAKVISDLMKKIDLEVDSLNLKQKQEMDLKIDQLDISTTSEDINNLIAQQYSTQSYVQKKFESELEAKRGHQKNEYREWITVQVSKTFDVSPIATPLGNRSSMFVSQAPSMEESFTIHLGSQLKHMHNIRILSANITDLCSTLHSDESLNGLNMALGLYSSSLCGVVVLTNKVQVNKTIFKNANMSTEFHFPQIDAQLEKIYEDIRKINNEKLTSDSPNKTIPKLNTGDFFITKHSNLSQSHVIFHLITDESFSTANEINSRHPVILGLRNILKISSRHDITTLTIPALLRHEMTEDMTVQWCIRRAELIFKCAKGFMIESSTWGGAELSTLQLLLPHNISEELFTTLSGMVPNIFRVANPKIL